jgi:hypothetical protein
VRTLEDKIDKLRKRRARLDDRLEAIDAEIATLEEVADTQHPTANTFANVCQTEFHVWVQVAPGQWASFPVFDGYIQGEVASNPGFCFNLRRALRTFAIKQMQKQQQIKMEQDNAIKLENERKKKQQQEEEELKKQEEERKR